jgi:dihydroorotate dehydrogenase (fumarate)
MDLTTTYLGLPLRNPLMPGASPLVDDLDQVRQLEDAGAAAIVMHSLFEEQIEREHVGRTRHFEAHAESFAEALTYFPDPDDYVMGPDRYLEQLRRIKQAVSVPVIASLNGTTPAGWLEYGRQMQQAGADALELNLYYVATDLDADGAEVDRRVVETARTVKRGLAIPVALKLSPFYSSFAHLARQLDDLPVDGLVIFNRFYQPQIDVESLEVVPLLQLSDSSELLLRLRWLAILSGRVNFSLAVTGGVHTPIDAVRAVMAGAHAVQMVSALLLYGVPYLQTVLTGMTHWMEEHEYSSITQMRGSMSLERCPDPAAFERANYMRVLQSWR